MNDVECSRVGCRLPAVCVIEWRNPRLHHDGRRKRWASCDTHRDYLRDFLGARGFPLTIRSLREDAE